MLTFIRLVMLVAIVVGSGCGSAPDTGSGSRTLTDTGASEPTVTVSKESKCQTSGPVACACPDGTVTGVQQCTSEGALTKCACPTASDTSAPETSDVLGLCSELQGLSGCEASQYVATELPASVLFLVDRSGSMNCNLPPTQGSAECEMTATPVDTTLPTKWSITTNALKEVFSDLSVQGTHASIGLSVFSTNGECGVDSVPLVPVGPLSQAQTASLTASMDAIQPDGSTPIVGALTTAYAYLHQEVNNIPGCSDPCGAHGNRYVVLITDGEDSCPDPTRNADLATCTAAGSCTQLLLDSTAPLALAANIRTFVIGSPGSETARGFLSELAFVAGTARDLSCTHDVANNVGDCHFDMTISPDTFAQDLASALANIGGAALACEYAVPDTGEAVDPDDVNVQVTTGGDASEPSCLPRDTSAPCDGGANGWQFAKSADGSDDLTRVVLCGSACDAVRADPKAKVDVIRGCESIVLL